MCCCSLSLPLPDPVSILSNPLFGTPALVSCAHPHAMLRFLCVFSHAHTHLRYTFAPFPRSIRCEAAATRSRRRYAPSRALPTPVARLARVGAALEARHLTQLLHAPVWRTAAWLLERDQEIFRALTDRASGRTLVGRHAGSMPPFRVVLGHAVVVSGPFRPPSSSFDIPLFSVNVRVYSCVWVAPIPITSKEPPLGYT